MNPTTPNELYTCSDLGSKPKKSYKASAEFGRYLIFMSEKEFIEYFNEKPTIFKTNDVEVDGIKNNTKNG